MKIRKLCIAIPNFGSIKSETVNCLMGASFETVMKLGCGLHLYLPSGGSIIECRNNAAQEALDVGASHLMFIDSDQTFPSNGILALNERNKRVIGANYNLKRAEPLLSTVKIADENGNLLEVPGDRIPTYPFKAYAVATGFLLIQTDIFKEIDKPWFLIEYDGAKDTEIGEDVYFCKKVRAKGIDVWCDPTIRVGHIGDYVY